MFGFDISCIFNTHYNPAIVKSVIGVNKKKKIEKISHIWYFSFKDESHEVRSENSEFNLKMMCYFFEFKHNNCFIASSF